MLDQVKASPSRSSCHREGEERKAFSAASCRYSQLLLFWVIPKDGVFVLVTLSVFMLCCCF